MARPGVAPPPGGPLTRAAADLTATVVGAVSWNLLVEVPHLPRDLTTLHATGVRESIGATGAGKALALAHLGVRTRLHALLGDDEPGRRARAVLAGAGVDLTWWADPAGTERHLNLMDPHGDRLSVFLSHQSPDPDVDPAALADLARGADVVLVSLTSYSRRVLRPLAEAGVPVWVDLHDWDGRPDDVRGPFVEHGRFVFVSDVRLPRADAVARGLAPEKELVVVTHGSRGATAYLPGGDVLAVPPVDVGPAVDSNGAGDAFCAGTAYGWARGWGWERSLRAGAVLAGGCVASPRLADPVLTEAWLLDRV